MENNYSLDGVHAQQQSQKFSRYRSVRAKSSDPPVQILQKQEITRTPSRYHRKAQAVSAPPPLPKQPSGYPYNAQTSSSGLSSPIQSSGAQRLPNRTNVINAAFGKRNGIYHFEQVVRSEESYEPRHDPLRSLVASGGTKPVTAPKAYYEAAREEARLILEGEYDRMQKLKRFQEKHQQNTGSEVPNLSRRRDVRPQVEPKRVVEERSKPMAVRETSKTETRKASVPDNPPMSPARFRTFVIGGNNKKEDVREEPMRKSRPEPIREVEDIPHFQPPTQIPKQEVQVSPKIPEPVRAFDAPVSAVNAGDRRVEIKCNQAIITLPVTPSTTVKDLLNSASTCMSESIDPRTAVMLESFSQLGLERPLRTYERIRDVMNSWDTDMQNHLVIMPASECDAVGLEQNDAPSRQPGDTSLQIYHSLKPGKWDKKWVRLREDGQVTVSKSQDGTESINICHLSDFDTYTPTRKQVKKVKAPKKICIAIKSQQKSATFLHGVNFAHFFCTNDKAIADRWYNATQSWRSWYLVDILGEGKKKKPGLLSEFNDQQRPDSAESKDSVPYQLGSFKPLLDFSDFRLSVDESSTQNAFPKRAISNAGNIPHSRLSSDLGPGRPSLDIRGQHRDRILPPSSFPKRAMRNSVEGDPSEDSNLPLFTGGSLLARSASVKSQGGHASGRGVQGAKGKPLIDLNAMSEFTDGSLLRKMQAHTNQNGLPEPKIDREKRVEASVKVGEGYD